MKRFLLILALSGTLASAGDKKALKLADKHRKQLRALNETGEVWQALCKGKDQVPDSQLGCIEAPKAPKVQAPEIKK